MSPNADYEGRVCPVSFARLPCDRVIPLDDVWGACQDCAEIINMRSGKVPEHRVADAARLKWLAEVGPLPPIGRSEP